MRHGRAGWSLAGWVAAVGPGASVRRRWGWARVRLRAGVGRASGRGSVGRRWCDGLRLACGYGFGQGRVGGELGAGLLDGAGAVG